MTNADNPERNYGFLLHEVARLLRRDFDCRAKQLGLTQGQWRAIAYLSRNEGANQVALAEILEVQPITLARLVDRLEAAGWVERRPDPNDRRAQRLYLTDAALPLLDRIRALAAETREKALVGLSSEARRQLIDNLLTIKGNLSEDSEVPGEAPYRKARTIKHG